MQNDILFDNIYIGHSIADAEALKKETFDVKVAVEKSEEEKDKPKEEDSPFQNSQDLSFTEDPVNYVKQKFDLFVTLAKRDPVQAIKFVPEIAAALGVGALTLIVILAGLVSGGAAAAPSKEQIKAKAKEVKDAAVDAKDQAAEAIATGTEKAKDEVNRRTTRSSTTAE